VFALNRRCWTGVTCYGLLFSTRIRAHAVSGISEVHLRTTIEWCYGGQPSRGLPTVAHALVGKRERRLERATGIELS
jgi:hypothetical protein